jgi:small-conductance mechanosensitive channel
VRWLIAVEAAELAATSIDPWHVVGAVLALLGGWIASRIVRRAVRRVVDRVDGISPQMRTFAVKSSGYLVVFIGFGVALAFLGVDIQPLLVVVVLAAVVLGLALRGLADNVAAGVVIQTRHPIRVGDEIGASGFVGVVRETSSRAVVVETADGRLVHLPNAELLDNPLVNNTVAGARRSEIEVRMESHDPVAARRRIMAATAAVDGVLTDPAPMGLFTAVEPDRVTVRVRFWHDPMAGVTVTSDVVQAVAAAVTHDGGTGTAVAPPPVAPLTPSPKV